MFFQALECLHTLDCSQWHFVARAWYFVHTSTQKPIPPDSLCCQHSPDLYDSTCSSQHVRLCVVHGPPHQAVIRCSTHARFVWKLSQSRLLAAFWSLAVCLFLGEGGGHCLFVSVLSSSFCNVFAMALVRRWSSNCSTVECYTARLPLRHYFGSRDSSAKK